MGHPFPRLGQRGQRLSHPPSNDDYYGSLISDILSVGTDQLPDFAPSITEIVNVTDSLPDPVPTIDADPFAFQGGTLGNGSQNQKDPIDQLKEKAKDVLKALKDCAALLGGAKNAESLVDKAKFVNVDNPGPLSVNGEEARKSIQLRDAKTGPLFAAAAADIPPFGTNSMGGYHIYTGNNFWGLSPGAQLDLFFHELGHTNGRPEETSDAERAKIDDEIKEKCGTK